MRHLKSILIALGGAILILGGIAFFLKSSYKLQKIKQVNATQSEIFSWISQLKKWPHWTAWNESKYPGMKIDFTGPETGVGSLMNWKTEDGEDGQVKIINYNPSRSIEFEVILDKNFTSKGKIILVPKSSGTEVQWMMEGDVGNDFAGRYFLLFAERFIAPDLEIGLENLKKNCEKD